ncbi:hypothetical protein VTK73DRAFT_6508 [Phialemonium thermophilum]|uniref:Uncharacterized protein n=1 Tax=Phialemonium thermophilum TaxID=223376 RepID=A0ABR3UZ96_9PEZI
MPLLNVQNYMPPFDLAVGLADNTLYLQLVLHSAAFAATLEVHITLYYYALPTIRFRPRMGILLVGALDGPSAESPGGQGSRVRTTPLCLSSQQARHPNPGSAGHLLP